MGTCFSRCGSPAVIFLSHGKRGKHGKLFFFERFVRAIINVFENLIFKNMPFGKINYTFLGGASIGKYCDDMIAVMDIEKLSDFPKFRLGIFSCGDGVNLINPVRDLIIEKTRCDVIICAAQSENLAIYSKLTSFALEAKRPYRTSSESSPLPPSISVSTNHYRAGIIATLTDLL